MDFLCLVDICPLSDTRVVKGEVLDKEDRTKWLRIENQTIPAGTFIRAGSVVVKDEAAVKKEVKLGIYVSAGETRHFNLEDVFKGEVDYFGQRVPLTEVLRSYGVMTLEGISENKPAFRPLVDKKKGTLKSQEVLMMYAVDKDQFEDWMRQVNRILGS